MEKVDEYEYSSYNDYVNIDSSFIDKDFVYGLISKVGFIEFNNENSRV